MFEINIYIYIAPGCSGQPANDLYFRLPVVLFGSPGISSWHATMVSVESLSLHLHYIKMLVICLP